MPPKRKPTSSNSNISNIITLAWCFIIFWIIVLSYAWLSGYLHSSDRPSLRYVDKVLTDTEENLKNGLLHLHVPQLPLLNSYKHYDSNYKVHTIFSTDCSSYQDWQTIIVFHSASVVKQPGPLTRIAR